MASGIRLRPTKHDQPSAIEPERLRKRANTSWKHCETCAAVLTLAPTGLPQPGLLAIEGTRIKIMLQYAVYTEGAIPLMG